MANVLSDEKKQQVIALGRLGWTLRRIQGATGVRRETAAGYLKAAGIPVRPPGWERRAGSKPAIEVITDFGAGKPASGVSSDPASPEPHLPPSSAPDTAKPATEVTADFGAERQSLRRLSISSAGWRIAKLCASVAGLHSAPAGGLDAARWRGKLAATSCGDLNAPLEFLHFRSQGTRTHCFPSNGHHLQFAPQTNLTVILSLAFQGEGRFSLYVGMRRADRPFLSRPGLRCELG